MTTKFLSVLSGGLDSTVNLYKAIQEHGWVPSLALTFNYGQKSAPKEIAAARKTAGLFEMKHQVIELPWFQDLSFASTLTSSGHVPHPTQSSLDDYEQSLQTAKSVWVPNRNGLFLNIAACYAEAHDTPVILTGFNQEEATTFPDNSEDFLKAINHAFSYSTQTHAKASSLTGALNKREIAAQALALGVPLENLWFCYESGDRACGRCESCLRDIRAFAAHGVNFYERVYGIKN